MTRGVLLPALLAAVVGCSAPAPPPKFRLAVQQERQGRYEQAIQTYREVAETARRRRFRLEAAMRRAGLLARLGRCKEAVRAYLDLEHGLGRGTREGARALFRAGVVLADCLRDTSRAMVLWKRAVFGYPKTVAAEDALARIVSVLRAQGRHRALVAFLETVARRSPPGDLWARAVWEASRVYLEDLKEPRAALALCQLLANEAPESPLADDATYCAGRILEKLGRGYDAIVWYRRLLRTKTSAWLVGSYNSEWLDDAQLAVGRVYLDLIGDWRKAYRAFMKLADEFRDSVLRDDGMWWACLALLRGGRVRRAMALWRRLCKRFPDSRFVRQGRALRDWAAVASALASGNRERICAALARHAKQHPFGWFRRRRRHIARRYGCPGT